MFGNECLECVKNNHVGEEKDKKLHVFQNNLFELKSKIVESNNLINIYFTYKNENESLKKENESLRKKTERVGSNSQMNYDVIINIYFIFS
jgi:hypothetical protein